MKHIYIICILLVLFSSCKYEEQAIFDLTPAERLNKAMADSYATLTSAANGWELAYFANPESAGYTILVTFQKNGMAQLASRSELTLNKGYEQDSCLYEMVADYGPVLTFNTFSNVLHRFSTPENPDGYGLQGDYEFIVLSSTQQQVVLKGKKYKSIIVLQKLDENINWQNHLQQIENTDKLLFSATSPKLLLTIKGSTYSFSGGVSHIFKMKKKGTTNSSNVPFIVTKQGLRLQDAVEIEGLSFQEFQLNADNSALVSVENPDYKLTGTDDLAAFAMNNLKIWNFNPENMSAGLKSAYTNMFDGFKSAYNADELKLSVSYFISRFILTVTYSKDNIKTEGKIDLNINATAKDALSISKKTTADTNGTVFLTDVAALNQFITLFSGNFTLSTTTKLNPQLVKFTKAFDSNQWFVVSDN